MAFSQATPADVPSAISTLCSFLTNQMGWTAVYDSGTQTGTVTIPGRGATFTLTRGQYQYPYSSSFGGYDYEFLQVDVAGVAAPWMARCNCLNPLTRMYVFAGTSPEPWVHVTFETAPGYFQHLYFGYVEKYGNYSGGAIADATYWQITTSQYNRSWEGSNNHLLFGGKNSYDTNYGKGAGALEIDHVDAPGDAYHFCYRGQKTYIAGGGWGDGYNARLAFVEPTGIEGNVIFHPVILFADINSNRFVCPVACVPGVRIINISSFDPGQSVSVGNQNWRIFPMCNKLNPYSGTVSQYPDQGPGNIQPDSGGTYEFHMGGGTENFGIAILEE